VEQVFRSMDEILSELEALDEETTEILNGIKEMFA
jgi:type I restriction enzyme M protein